jgi:hypothetical protein
MSNIHKVNNNIYITSDEEIKEGDWVYSKSRNKICKVTGISKWTHKDDYSIDLDNENYFIHHSYCKKIILTTDRDLIGVQAIDDAFLEWFVKNPSCEFVKTDKVDTFKKTNEVYVDEITGGNYYEVNKQYKIIIPKEEPKQEKDLAYWKANAEEDYIKVPISVLRYITELEKRMYSEEDVREAIVKSAMSNTDNMIERCDEIIEQFKNK